MNEEDIEKTKTSTYLIKPSDNKKFGALSSSVSPDQLASRVKGIILATSSVVIFLVARFAGLELSPEDMVSVATSLGGLAGAIWSVYGLIQMFVARVASR